MSHAKDKTPAPSPTHTLTADKDTRPENAQPVPCKDPNEYDPVGMAGKKAGIVEELGEEDSDTSNDTSNAGNTKGHGAVPGAPGQKD